MPDRGEKRGRGSALRRGGLASARDSRGSQSRRGGLTAR